MYVDTYTRSHPRRRCQCSCRCNPPGPRRGAAGRAAAGRVRAWRTWCSVRCCSIRCCSVRCSQVTLLLGGVATSQWWALADMFVWWPWPLHAYFMRGVFMSLCLAATNKQLQTGLRHSISCRRLVDTLDLSNRWRNFKQSTVLLMYQL